jgi:alpha-tubulin suppressor-like RCC1 family protein
VGGTHACGTTATGTVHCWGSNVNGALGNGTSSPGTTPSTVNSAMPLAFVTAGGAHSCAVSPIAIAQCWGANAAGQLGNGTSASAFSPTAAPSATNMSLMSSGPDYTCGVTAGAAIGLTFR